MRVVYEFGAFRADPTERLLVRDGVRVAVSGKTLDLLFLLVKNAGRLVEKAHLLREIWGDVYVEESNVAVTVSMLRKALGEDPVEFRFIQTVSKRGYRFIAPVRELLHAGTVVGATNVRTIPVAVPPGGAQSAAARQLYSEGRYFWNKRTEDGLRRSIECFQRANREDPTFAAAYAGLADSYALLASYGVDSPQNAYPAAKAAALHALELDPDSVEAHTSLGMTSFFYEWTWEQAEAHFEKALQLNPDYPLAHTWYAVHLAAMKRCQQAIGHVELAHGLDPLSLVVNTELGRVFYLCRRYDDAIRAFTRALDLEPHFCRAHTRLAMTYAAMHDFHRAIREFHKVEPVAGNDPYLEGLLGYCYASVGEEYVARELLEKLTRKDQKRFVPAYSVALICIGLMDRGMALEWLEKSYEDRSTYLVFAQTDPLLDPVRGDARFHHLLRSMNLDRSDNTPIGVFNEILLSSH